MESNKEVSEEVKVKSLQECKDQVAVKYCYTGWCLKIHENGDHFTEKLFNEAAELYASQFKSETTSLREENERLRKEALEREEYIGELREAIYYPDKSLKSELERVTKENEELKAKI
jgi:hypothetical protein